MTITGPRYLNFAGSLLDVIRRLTSKIWKRFKGTPPGVKYYG